MKNKTKIEIKGQKKYLYSTRQITQIVDIISEKHYKNEIIQEIANTQNINNIIILDESAKVNQKYKDIHEKEFKLDSNTLLNIYHKGNPISMVIDKKIMLMNKSFELFKELYQHYRENDNKMTLDTKEKLLFELYEIITSKNYEESKLDKFFEKNSSYNQKKREKIKRELENIEILYEKHKIYKNLNNKDNVDENNYRSVKRLEKEFLKNFSKLSKPMIYVQLDNDNWKMLGIKMIKEEHFEHSNSQFLDTNKIEQNSPLLIILSVSTLFLPTLLKLSKVLCESNKKKKKQEENVKELKNIIETIEKQYKDPDLTIKKINENEHKLNEIINKLPQDLKSKVTEMKEELIKNNISPLIENNISIDKVEILEESK